MTHPSDEYPIIIAYPFVSERSSTSAIDYIIVHFYSNVNTDLFTAPNHIAILTVFLVRWRRAGDLLTEKNCLNRSETEYFHLHRKRENMRKKPHHRKMTRLSQWLRRQ